MSMDISAPEEGRSLGKTVGPGTAAHVELTEVVDELDISVASAPELGESHRYRKRKARSKVNFIEHSNEGEMYKRHHNTSDFTSQRIEVFGFRNALPQNSPLAESTASRRRYMWMRRNLFGFLSHAHTMWYFLNAKLVFRVLLGILVVFLCHWFGIICKLHPALVLSAVTFPLSFSINASFQRRELALQALAGQKAASRSLLSTWKYWSEAFEVLGPEFMQESTKILSRMFKYQHAYLISANETFKFDLLHDVYDTMRRLSYQNEKVRAAGIPPPMTTQPTHRVFYLIENFEKLRVICDYRTPTSLRGFNSVFVSVTSVLLAPYFCWLGEEHGRWVSYFVVVFTTFLFCCLLQVQHMLEDPFANSQDDINLEAVDKWFELTMKEYSGLEHSMGLSMTHPTVGDTTAPENKTVSNDPMAGGYTGNEPALRATDILPASQSPPRVPVSHRERRKSLTQAGLDVSKFEASSARRGSSSASLAPMLVPPEGCRDSTIKIPGFEFGDAGSESSEDIPSLPSGASAPILVPVPTKRASFKMGGCVNPPPQATAAPQEQEGAAELGGGALQ